MKKTSLIAALSLLSFFAPVHAAGTRPGFELGAEFFDYGYRERLDGKTVAKDDGRFGGATLSYVETVGAGNFLRARLSTTFGSVDYRSPSANLIGTNGPPARIDNVSQDISQLELGFGHDFRLRGGGSVTLFTGIGARVLNDRSGSKAEQGGYDREISYGYLPLGGAASVPLGTSGPSLLVSAQYNWVIYGEAKSKFSKLDPELPDIKLDLRNGSGVELVAALRFPLGKRAITVGPFGRFWSISRSKTLVLTDPEAPGEAIQFFEPKNRSREIGIRLGFAF
jgi:hypothetical protein